MDTTEKLREALLNLEESRKREQQQRKISETLLAGLRAMVLAKDPDEIFRELLDVLREPLGFEAAFVLRENSDGSLLATASSDPSFADTVWQPKAMFERAFAGQPVAVYDTELVDEWRFLPDPIKQRARSALHFAIHTSEPRALFVCTHSERAHFSQQHVTLAHRFSVLATQALQKIEYGFEITDLKRAQERIEHLNLVLRAVRNVNQLITKEKDRDRLLQGICDILTEDRGYANAWITVLNDEQKAIATAESGLGASFEPMVERLRRGELTHCAKTALDLGEAVVEDPVRECADCPLASEYSGRTGVSVRLEHEGKVHGLISVSVPREFAHDEDERSLFREVAGDIAFALHSREVEDERKRAESALRESESKHRTLLENLPQKIFLKDKHSAYISCNENYAQDLGIMPEEIVGKTDFDFYPRALAEKYRADDKRLIETGRTEEIEEQYVQHGKRVWARTVKTPVRDDKGTVIGILGIFWDITERRRAESALRENEEKFRSYVENAPDGIFITDAGGRYVDVNPAACRMTGYSREELLGMAFPELISSDSPPRSLRFFSNLRKTGNAQGEGLLRRKDGTDIPVSLEAVVLSDHRFMAFCSDITERKKAEKALKESNENYQLVVSNITTVVWKADIANDGTFENTYTSPVADELLELPAGTLQDDWDKYFRYIKPEYLERVNSAFREAIESPGKLIDCEYEVLKENGQTAWFHSKGRCFEKNGKLHVFGSTTDITERKRLQEQILQAQKMESVGRLAGGVAHDFNNLLTVILMSCSLMVKDLREGDPLLEDVRQIESAGKRAESLTRQLLAFSRKQLLQTEVLDLNQTLENLDKMLRRLIGEDIDIATEMDPSVWKVEADPGQIEQIVLNLAVNARDAMPTGGKLTMETANVELDEEYARNHIDITPGPYVMLAVSDTGCGMDAETVAQIFDPFFTTKEKDKGTGLGLSTVYGIVKQHGGNIWVDSEPGKGTTFKIYLPRAKTTEMTVRKDRETVKDSRGTETVLMVEDAKAVLRLGVRVLESEGYKVLQARDGLEGQTVANAYEGPIHLLLTDVVMPRSSGKELAEKLLATRPELKVLYMSGYTDDAIAHHGVLDKGTHLVQKPFSVDSLAKKVREVLDHEDDGPG